MGNAIDQLGAHTLVAVTIIAALAAGLHLRWNRRNVMVGPTLLTTTGIFFCFLGIALGLADFNTKDIEGSVPPLLDGIKTSFWASVAGIFAALTIKVRALLIGEPALKGDASTGATVDDLHASLVRLNRVIAGEEDSTLLNQIKLGRSDSNDRLDRLRSSIDNYAKTVAEANSKALIEALSEIIRDFNTKLNEQFGENFKQLNAAVEKLVVWQAQYKDQMISLIEQETATRKTMTEASLRYADLVSKAGIYTTTAESLDRILTEMGTQSERLNSALRSLSELVVKASDGLPNIERQIVEMTRQIASGVQSNQETLGAVIKASVQTMQTQSQEVTKSLKESMSLAQTELNNHLRQASDESAKHIEQLDKALSEELTKSLNALGSQLATLSNKFAQDYTPITEGLRRALEAVRVA
jgi:chromosome segregation ATPase